MTFAMFLLLLAALLILYYYLVMHQIYGKISDIFGIFAGLWSFLGIFGIYLGLIGFSYFLIFIIIIIIGYLIQFSLKLLPDSAVEVIEKAQDYLDNAPELNVHEKILDKIPSLENTSERWGLAIICFGVVFILYISFFTIPVSPADTDDTFQFDREEGYMKHLPNTYRIDYKKGDAIVVIVTLRTIPISPKMYSDRLKKEVSEITEEKAKTEYGQDIRVEYKGEEDKKINGHDAIMQNYDIFRKTSGGIFGGGGETNVADMAILAWFCNKDFETVVVGYVYPPNLKSTTNNLVDSIDCH